MNDRNGSINDVNDHIDKVKNTMFSLKEDFVILPHLLIYKHFYNLTVIKELNRDCH